MLKVKHNNGSKILNSYLLKKKSVIALPTGYNSNGTDEAKVQVATLNLNIESLGFTFSKDLFEALIAYFSESPEYISLFAVQLIDDLKEMVGADVKYKPFYPDFPKQVMQLSEAELYINAFLHYLTGGQYRLSDSSELQTRFINRFKNKNLKVIGLASFEDYMNFIQSLVYSNVSISANDAESLKEMLNALSSKAWEEFDLFTEPVTNKENLMYFIKALEGTPIPPTVKSTITNRAILPSFNNAADAVRLALALSGEDITFTGKPHFKNFTNQQRILLMKIIEKCPNPVEDLLRTQYLKNATKRLAKAIHPKTFEKRFPRAYTVFNTVCSDTKVEKYSTKVYNAINNIESVDEAVKLLKSRPGEFALNLDKLLVMCKGSVEKSIEVLNTFDTVADKVSTKVLISMLTAFNTRNTVDDRFALLKGKEAKIKAWKETREPLPNPTLLLLRSVLTSALRKKFSEGEELGKVYLNPALKTYVFPTNMRNLTEHTRNYARGTRIPFDSEWNIIRSFIYWDKVPDIDLSCVLLDEDFRQIGYVNFGNLRESRFGIYHSGDITDGRRGAAEFIDIDIPTALAQGVRYISMNVNVYSAGYTFEDTNKCYAGIMLRSKDLAINDADGVLRGVAQGGNIYEAESVVSKTDLKTATRSHMPYVIDLKEHCIIVTDLGPDVLNRVNSVINQLDTITANIKMIATTKYTSIWDIINLHVVARKGTLVDNPEDADIIFDLEQGIKPYDLTTLATDWM